MGSPRKGNTYRACEEFREHLQKTCLAEFEYIWLKDSRIELKGAYDIQARYIAELDLSLSDLSLEDLGVQSKKDKMPVKGSLSGDVKIMFPGRDISDTNILGQIDGTDFYFNFRGIHSPISDCNFQLEFSGKQVAINHWNMKIGEDSLSIIGRLKGWNGLKGDIKINSDFTIPCVDCSN